jgi:hypothetical protein
MTGHDVCGAEREIAAPSIISALHGRCLVYCRLPGFILSDTSMLTLRHHILRNVVAPWSASALPPASPVLRFGQPYLNMGSLLSTKATASLPSFDPTPPAKPTQSPDPGWAWRDGIRDEAANGKVWKAEAEQGWKTWHPESSDKGAMYKLLTSAIIPRPVAFVSTVSEDGVRNLAPFRYAFCLVCLIILAQVYRTATSPWWAPPRYVTHSPF